MVSGDWVNGKREGRGEEISQYGQYKGGWRGDVKHGYGEERSLVGTIFEGTWEKGRKNGRGVRKMIFGAVYEQVFLIIIIIATISLLEHYLPRVFVLV